MKVTVWIWALVLVSTTDADFRFSNLYGDGMVLQMEPAQANVWGYADQIGDTITILLDGAQVVTTTVFNSNSAQLGSSGKWSVLLPATAAGGPHTLKISSSAGSRTLTDVWFGDVWFCSGQSNMDFAVFKIFDSDATIATASKMTNIRFFQVERNVQGNAVEEAGIDSAWQTAANDDPTNNFSGLCLLYAMELSSHINDRPIGLIQSTWGGTPIEAWSSADALGACPYNNNNYGYSDQQKDSWLWNGMIVPVLPTTIYGVIWYQGESNDPYPQDYKCSFAAMVDDWRAKFHTESEGQTNEMLPFGFVQLAAYRKELLQTGFPDVRWAQTYNYGYVPNPGLEDVFMAVAMDLPDYESPYGSVHPRDKKDIAVRLVIAARAVAYGESELDFQGPFPTSFTAGDGTMTVEYDDGNSVILVQADHGFEVCCVDYEGQPCDNNWNFVSISSSDETSLTLETSVCAGRTVGGVRYAWEESPCGMKQCAVYDNSNDLPAPPFVKEAPFS